MKKMFMVLMLLITAKGTLMAGKSSSHSHSHKERHKCHKATCAATPIKKPVTITKSGSYCLVNDINGTIVIAANNVVLDLNSHTVNGLGTPAAIIGENIQDVTVKNGRVVNLGSLAINFINSIGVLIADVQVTDSNQALALVNCESSSVTDFKAYNNLNTAGALVFLNNCDSIELINLKANNNTKELGGLVDDVTDPAVGIIAMSTCTNVKLTNCTTNGNVLANQNVRFAPLAGLFSSNIIVTNCQSNENMTLGEAPLGFAPIYFNSCQGLVIEGCQVNLNRLESTNNFFRGIFLFNTDSVIKNCQVMDNLVILLQEPPVAPPLSISDMTGIYCSNLLSKFEGEQINNIISHCQVTGNSVATAGRIDDLGVEIQINGICLVGNTTFPARQANQSLVEYCQVNSNFVDIGFDPIVAGIRMENCVDVTVANCSADGNSGGLIAYGIIALGRPNSQEGLGCFNVKVMNCTANFLRSSLAAVGIFLGGNIENPSINCLVIGCQANVNREAEIGYGIVLSNANDCSVIDCQTDSNGTAGVKAGRFNTFEVSNRDCSIINCSANGNGNGFELDENSNVHFLIQDNVAIGNHGVGFLHSPAELTSRYLGNYAKNNFDENYLINGGAIQIFSLDSMGIYTRVSGDEFHFSELINISAED